MSVSDQPRDVPPRQASRGSARSMMDAVVASPATPPPPAPPPGPPAPVAGLDQAQMNNAAVIVRVGAELNLPTRAKIVAIACAMQESKLRNLASGRIAESMQLANEGVGYDADSVGLFQQRPSMGWGTVAQLLDPNYSARAFYNGLVKVKGWERMEVTLAAQAVQISAYPYAYAKHEPLAQQVVAALHG